MSEKDIIDALSAPFSEEDIEWQAARRRDADELMVPFVKVRALQMRLDRVVPLRWSTAYTVPVPDTVLATIRLTLFHDAVPVALERQNGFSGPPGTPIKNLVAGAFQRACMELGLGRYLYAILPQWIPLTTEGKRAYRATIPTGFLPDGLAQSDPEYKTALQYLHAAGGEVYGRDWDKERAEVIALYAAQLGYVATSSRDLPTPHLRRLAEHIKRGGGSGSPLRAAPKPARTLPLGDDPVSGLPWD